MQRGRWTISGPTGKTNDRREAEKLGGYNAA